MQSVLETVWPWQTRKSEGVTVRQVPVGRALFQAGIMAAILLLFFYLRHGWVVGIVGVLLAADLVGAFFIPPLYFAMEKFGLLLARWVGTGLTYILLVPFFFICFVPARILLKLSGRDPMCRQWEKAKPTYWVDKPAPLDAAHFTRQYS